MATMANGSVSPGNKCQFVDLSMLGNYAKDIIISSNIQLCQQRSMCIKRLFWPPYEAKNENCFSQVSSLVY